MEVLYDKQDDRYYIQEQVNGQTFMMEMAMIDWNDDTVYFNVYLHLYSKRKHMVVEESEARTTGKQSFMKTWILAKEAFLLLEKEVLRDYSHYNVVIYVAWSDNRRRDIYYHYLSKIGYQYGRDTDNKKCIFKKFKRKD